MEISNNNYNILICGEAINTEFCIKIMTEINEIKKVDEYKIFTNHYNQKQYKNYKDTYYGYNKDIKDIIENITNKQIEDTKNNNAKHILVVFDDIFIDSNLQNFVLNAKNLNISFIITMRHPSHDRFNSYFDFIFSFLCKDIFMQRYLYRYYGNIFTNFQSFKECIMKLKKK
jgi:hypothetical protein